MRLWFVAVVVGCAAVVALAAGGAGVSLWPAVGLFAVFGCVACVAAACDASAADIAAQETGDLGDRLEAIEERLKGDAEAVAKVINGHAADIEYLKKRGAMNDALGQ